MNVGLNEVPEERIVGNTIVEILTAFDGPCPCVDSQVSADHVIVSGTISGVSGLSLIGRDGVVTGNDTDYLHDIFFFLIVSQYHFSCQHPAPRNSYFEQKFNRAFYSKAR